MKPLSILKKNISDITSYKKTVNRPLILDGAVGSLLQQKGISDKDLWTSKANLTEKEKVIDVHKSYIKAGADIITTNTFRTNPIAYSQSGLKHNYSKFVNESVELAYEAVSEANVYIAASNAPAEDCYQVKRKLRSEELIVNHQKHITELWQTDKVDFILNETFSHFDEIKIVSEFCSNRNIPYVLSLFTIDGKTILSGEKIQDIINLILDFNPIAISFNCIFPSVMKIINKSIKFVFPNAFYLNCGSGQFEDEEIKCGISPEMYLDYVLKFTNENMLFVGSCCGSNPKHTKILRNYFDK